MENVIKAIRRRKKMTEAMKKEDSGEKFNKYNEGYDDALEFVLELLEEEDLL
jgi:hypothetical protein